MNHIYSRILNDKSKLVIICIIIAVTFELPISMYKLFFNNTYQFDIFLSGYAAGVLSLSAITAALTIKNYKC